jgi:hypothetical protein
MALSSGAVPVVGDPPGLKHGDTKVTEMHGAITKITAQALMRGMRRALTR